MAAGARPFLLKLTITNQKKLYYNLFCLSAFFALRSSAIVRAGRDIVMLYLRHRPKLIWIAIYAVVLNLIGAGGHVHMEAEPGDPIDTVPHYSLPHGHSAIPGRAEDGQCQLCWSLAIGGSLLPPNPSAGLAAFFPRQWRTVPISRIAARFKVAVFHARAPPFRQFTSPHSS